LAECDPDLKAHEIPGLYGEQRELISVSAKPADTIFKLPQKASSRDTL
jgi:hypothetical protein